MAIFPNKNPLKPPKINSSNLKMMVWKMVFLFQGCILRFQPLIFQGVNHMFFCFKGIKWYDFQKTHGWFFRFSTKKQSTRNEALELSIRNAHGFFWFLQNSAPRLCVFFRSWLKKFLADDLSGSHTTHVWQFTYIYHKNSKKCRWIYQSHAWYGYDFEDLIDGNSLELRFWRCHLPLRYGLGSKSAVEIHCWCWTKSHQDYEDVSPRCLE